MSNSDKQHISLEYTQKFAGCLFDVVVEAANNCDPDAARWVAEAVKRMKQHE